jgi:hypothetical protein
MLGLLCMFKQSLAASGFFAHFNLGDLFAFSAVMAALAAATTFLTIPPSPLPVFVPVLCLASSVLFLISTLVFSIGQSLKS